MANETVKGKKPSDNNKKSVEAKKKAAEAAPAPAKKKKAKVDNGEPHTEQLRIHVPPNPNSTTNKILPYVFVLCAVLVLVFLISGSTSGFLGKWANVLCFGMFGWGAWVIPVLLAVFGWRWRRIVEDDSRMGSVIFSVLLVASLSAFIHTCYTADPVIKGLLTLGKGGGVIGGLLSFVLTKTVGRFCTFLITVCLTVVMTMLFLSITPKDIWIYIRYSLKVSAEKREMRNERREAERAAEEERLERLRIEKEEARRTAAMLKKAELAAEDDGFITDEEPTKSQAKAADIPAPVINVALGDDSVYENEPEEEEAPFEELTVPEEIPVETPAPIEPAEEKKAKDEPTEPAQKGKMILPDLEDIFGLGDPDKVNDLSGLEDPEELPEDITEAKQNAILETEAPKEEEKPKPKAEYRTPPISLLAVPEKPKTEDMTAEMQANAQRLVETLASFRVYTKITSVSVGPTITRYELQPEAGTSVKSIANRVDDIALSLASMGVRIEAPIPGKAAVGIEVPNKTAATVFLRELIASKQFTCEENKKRRLMAALGVDVAGVPVFCDIAKMPHMLVAGATGMGKSVCINSLLVSLLYRTSPDDLRLILVDPKRVELGTYNGIPHLLVPVVTEPQKAAGALSWAVNEMERRFGLIEEVGARNIGDYNGTVNGVPGYEKMPYIVIIIDELADLMLVARDTVENSINRLAAKARAAGIHLVIGTQRPSVDVITGLIKANIPSRIAFTVASQVDSRTIIDVGGAERLNGRGDMLYAPVGLMKPMRVQGSFVSTEEVERVTAFVRSNAGENEYSEEIMADIEREAQRCSAAKGGGGDELDGDDGGELDPKFRQAVELAVNNNKVATSLLQRNLSIGYGRAAKIIDQMERLGYVGPPDGTKPREVLITPAQFRELVVNDRLGVKNEEN
ncbi:MAG: DNA translocase FtsK [Clostridia bacterium]|nr:DNA translocase FtsK [Clostridia bacterium]